MIMTNTRWRRKMRISAHPSHVSWQRSRGGAISFGPFLTLRGPAGARWSHGAGDHEGTLALMIPLAFIAGSLSPSSPLRPLSPLSALAQSPRSLLDSRSPISPALIALAEPLALLALVTFGPVAPVAYLAILALLAMLALDVGGEADPFRVHSPPSPLGLSSPRSPRSPLRSSP